MGDCRIINNKVYIIYPNYRSNTIEAEYCSRNTYNLKRGHYFFVEGFDELVAIPGDEIAFEIGDLVDEFLCINKSVFELEHLFKIHKSLVPKLKHKHFVKYPSNLSILKKIDRLIEDNFYIMPDSSLDESVRSISWTEYNKLVSSFPTTTTAKHYLNKLVSEKIEEFFEVKANYDEIFEKHLEKRNHVLMTNTLFYDELDNEIVKSEMKKFKYAINLLKNMLSVGTLSEKEWQNKILEILLLIYPQYKFVISEIGLSNRKRVDYILVDLFNNIDIIEIKGPKKLILRHAKYRDNYVPSHELTGTIMQVEYYLRQLNENSQQNRNKIEKKLREKGFEEKIQINNVKGMIIFGRTKDFNTKQSQSYRIIKNQFSNIVNIISYDELLQMLEQTYNRFAQRGLSNVLK